jgi:hypothetical protein
MHDDAMGNEQWAVQVEALRKLPSLVSCPALISCQVAPSSPTRMSLCLQPSSYMDSSVAAPAPSKTAFTPLPPAASPPDALSTTAASSFDSMTSVPGSERSTPRDARVLPAEQVGHGQAKRHLGLARQCQSTLDAGRPHGYIRPSSTCSHRRACCANPRGVPNTGAEEAGCIAMSNGERCCPACCIFVGLSSCARQMASGVVLHDAYSLVCLVARVADAQLPQHSPPLPSRPLRGSLRLPRSTSDGGRLLRRPPPPAAFPTPPRSADCSTRSGCRWPSEPPRREACAQRFPYLSQKPPQQQEAYASTRLQMPMQTGRGMPFKPITRREKPKPGFGRGHSPQRNRIKRK